MPDFVTKWLSEQGPLIVAIGLGLWWIVPRLEKLLNAHLAFLGECSKSQQSTSRSVNMLAESFSVMGSALRMMSQKLFRIRGSALLIIEDSPADAMIVRRALAEIKKKYLLNVIEVSTLGAAHEYVMESRLIILDVGLPDVVFTKTTIEAFISLVDHCPVIVYTAEKGFSCEGAFRVVIKSDIDGLRDAATRALVTQR